MLLSAPVQHSKVCSSTTGACHVGQLTSSHLARYGMPHETEAEPKCQRRVSQMAHPSVPWISYRQPDDESTVKPKPVLMLQQHPRAAPARGLPRSWQGCQTCSYSSLQRRSCTASAGSPVRTLPSCSRTGVPLRRECAAAEHTPQLHVTCTVARLSANLQHFHMMSLRCLLRRPGSTPRTVAKLQSA